MQNDIDWVLNSPSLINVPNNAASFLDLLETTDLNMPAFNAKDFLARNLGGYYENLVSFIINNARYLLDIKRNIRVYNNKITLGEFDFIGSSRAGDFHLECAIKYYLRTGAGTELKDFIGPGKKDRLDLKYERMLNHQLKLSQTPQGIQACLQEGLRPSIFIMLIQGYLFHPFDEFGSQIELHPTINPNHLQGWWLRQNEVSNIKDADQYVIMKKPFWLIANRSNLLTYSELKLELLEMDRPILVSRFDKTGSEQDRGFIVPNEW